MGQNCSCEEGLRVWKCLHFEMWLEQTERSRNYRNMLYRKWLHWPEMTFKSEVNVFCNNPCSAWHRESHARQGLGREREPRLETMLVRMHGPGTAVNHVTDDFIITSLMQYFTTNANKKLNFESTICVTVVKSRQEPILPSWAQFHQRSTHSFFIGRLMPVKYKPKKVGTKKLRVQLTYVKAACITLVKLIPEEFFCLVEVRGSWQEIKF